jgi:hypothetical protein
MKISIDVDLATVPAQTPPLTLDEVTSALRAGITHLDRTLRISSEARSFGLLVVSSERPPVSIGKVRVEPAAPDPTPA